MNEETNHRNLDGREVGGGSSVHSSVDFYTKFEKLFSCSVDRAVFELLMCPQSHLSLFLLERSKSVKEVKKEDQIFVLTLRLIIELCLSGESVDLICKEIRHAVEAMEEEVSGIESFLVQIIKEHRHYLHDSSETGRKDLLGQVFFAIRNVYLKSRYESLLNWIKILKVLIQELFRHAILNFQDEESKHFEFQFHHSKMAHECFWELHKLMQVNPSIKSRVLSNLFFQLHQVLGKLGVYDHTKIAMLETLISVSNEQQLGEFGYTEESIKRQLSSEKQLLKFCGGRCESTTKYAKNLIRRLSKDLNLFQFKKHKPSFIPEKPDERCHYSFNELTREFCFHQKSSNAETEKTLLFEAPKDFSFGFKDMGNGYCVCLDPRRIGTYIFIFKGEQITLFTKEVIRMLQVGKYHVITEYREKREFGKVFLYYRGMYCGRIKSKRIKQLSNIEYVSIGCPIALFRGTRSSEVQLIVYQNIAGKQQAMVHRVMGIEDYNWVDKSFTQEIMIRLFSGFSSGSSDGLQMNISKLPPGPHVSFLHLMISTFIELGLTKSCSDCYRIIWNHYNKRYFYDVDEFRGKRNISRLKYFSDFSKPFQQLLLTLQYLNFHEDSIFSLIPRDVIQHVVIPYISESEYFLNHPNNIQAYEFAKIKLLGRIGIEMPIQRSPQNESKGVLWVDTSMRGLESLCVTREFFETLAGPLHEIAEMLVAMLENFAVQESEGILSKIRLLNALVISLHIELHRFVFGDTEKAILNELQQHRFLTHFADIGKKIFQVGRTQEERVIIREIKKGYFMFSDRICSVVKDCFDYFSPLFYYCGEYASSLSRQIPDDTRHPLFSMISLTQVFSSPDVKVDDPLKYYKSIRKIAEVLFIERTEEFRFSDILSTYSWNCSHASWVSKLDSFCQYITFTHSFVRFNLPKMKQDERVEFLKLLVTDYMGFFQFIDRNWNVPTKPEWRIPNQGTNKKVDMAIIQMYDSLNSSFDEKTFKVVFSDDKIVGRFVTECNCLLPFGGRSFNFSHALEHMSHVVFFSHCIMLFSMGGKCEKFVKLWKEEHGELSILVFRILTGGLFDGDAEQHRIHLPQLLYQFMWRYVTPLRAFISFIDEIGEEEYFEKSVVRGEDAEYKAYSMLDVKDRIHIRDLIRKENFSKNQALNAWLENKVGKYEDLVRWVKENPEISKKTVMFRIIPEEEKRHDLMEYVLRWIFNPETYEDEFKHDEYGLLDVLQTLVADGEKYVSCLEKVAVIDSGKVEVYCQSLADVFLKNIFSYHMSLVDMVETVQCEVVLGLYQMTEYFYTCMDLLVKMKKKGKCEGIIVCDESMTIIIDFTIFSLWCTSKLQFTTTQDVLAKTTAMRRFIRLAKFMSENAPLLTKLKIEGRMKLLHLLCGSVEKNIKIVDRVRNDLKAMCSEKEMKLHEFTKLFENYVTPIRNVRYESGSIEKSPGCDALFCSSLAFFHNLICMGHGEIPKSQTPSGLGGMWIIPNEMSDLKLNVATQGIDLSISGISKELLFFNSRTLSNSVDETSLRSFIDCNKMRLFWSSEDLQKVAESWIQEMKSIIPIELQKKEKKETNGGFNFLARPNIEEEDDKKYTIKYTKAVEELKKKSKVQAKPFFTSLTHEICSRKEFNSENSVAFLKTLLEYRDTSRLDIPHFFGDRPIMISKLFSTFTEEQMKDSIALLMTYFWKSLCNGQKVFMNGGFDDSCRFTRFDIVILIMWHNLSVNIPSFPDSIVPVNEIVGVIEIMVKFLGSGVFSSGKRDLMGYDRKCVALRILDDLLAIALRNEEMLSLLNGRVMVMLQRYINHLVNVSALELPKVEDMSVHDMDGLDKKSDWVSDKSFDPDVGPKVVYEVSIATKLLELLNIIPDEIDNFWVFFSTADRMFMAISSPMKLIQFGEKQYSAYLNFMKKLISLCLLESPKPKERKPKEKQWSESEKEETKPLNEADEFKFEEEEFVFGSQFSFNESEMETEIAKAEKSIEFKEYNPYYVPDFREFEKKEVSAVVEKKLESGSDFYDFIVSSSLFKNLFIFNPSTIPESSTVGVGVRSLMRKFEREVKNELLEMGKRLGKLSTMQDLEMKLENATQQDGVKKEIDLGREFEDVAAGFRIDTVYENDTVEFFGERHLTANRAETTENLETTDSTSTPLIMEQLRDSSVAHLMKKESEEEKEKEGDGHDQEERKIEDGNVENVEEKMTFGTFVLGKNPKKEDKKESNEKLEGSEVVFDLPEFKFDEDFKFDFEKESEDDGKGKEDKEIVFKFDKNSDDEGDVFQF